MNEGLVKSYAVDMVIPPRSQVKFGASDRTVTLATAATDDVIGVSGELQTDLTEMCDVALSGLAQVKLGGTVARGAKITAGAAGVGVAAAAGNKTALRAETDGVVGDIIPAMLIPGTVQA